MLMRRLTERNGIFFYLVSHDVAISDMYLNKKIKINTYFFKKTLTKIKNKL